jgi:nitrous oxidase accessory protein NosD
VRKMMILAIVLALGLALPMATPVRATPDEWHVYDGESIQDAVDAAQSGDTIIVHEGTYNEAVVIDKAVNLYGAKRDVDPRGDSWTGGVSLISPGIGNTGIDIEASGVTVNGFEVSGGNYGIYIGAVSLSNITISYNDLHNNAKYGLQAIGLGVDVSHIMISYHYMHHNGRNGLKLVDVTDCVVDSNEFAYNGFGSLATKPEYKFGVFLEDERYNSPYYSPCIRNTFTGNDFHDNQLGGINLEVMGSATSDYWSSREFLEGTVLHNNNFRGASSIWGIKVSNDYADDGSQDGYGTIATVDAVNNWWGDASGPSSLDPSNPVTDPVTGTQADGSGTMVSENIHFCPWLETPYTPVIEVDIIIKPGS